MEPQIIQYYRIRTPGRSPGVIKSSKIKNWKIQGIISDDWDKTYDRYIKTLFCEECNCLLVRQPHPLCKKTACIDHDHTITDKENIRNILCVSCNSKRQ